LKRREKEVKIWKLIDGTITLGPGGFSPFQFISVAKWQQNIS